MRGEVVPDFKIEQYLLGELSEAEKADILERPDLDERVRQIEDSNAEILRLYAPDRMAELIRARLSSGTGEVAVPSTPTGGARLLQFALDNRRGVAILAAAAVLALIGVTQFSTRPSVSRPRPGEVVRIKGLEPAMQIYRQSSEGAEKLENEASAAETDLLQISYNAAGIEYGSIFSIDGRGIVTLHYPDQENQPPVLKREGEVFLPFSYRLDDAPNFERFFFVTREAEFPVTIVLKAARELASSNAGGATGDLKLPKDFEQTSKVLLKGGRK